MRIKYVEKQTEKTNALWNNKIAIEILRGKKCYRKTEKYLKCNNRF